MPTGGHTRRRAAGAVVLAVASACAAASAAGCVAARTEAAAPERWSGRDVPAAALARAERPGESGGLAGATERLLQAIERETGERPVLPDGETGPVLDAETVREARREHRGWSIERLELSREILRAIDTGSATVKVLTRARAALRWDLALGARWGAVDRKVVLEALARADEVLPKPVVATVEPVKVTSGYGWRADPFGEGAKRHGGIDLAGLEGQLVRAAGPGEVVFAAKRGGYGKHVEIAHPGGLVSRYAHLSEIDVAPGQRIGAGEIIGRVGQTGRATGPHLHFELWRDGLPIDPMDELPMELRISER